MILNPRPAAPVPRPAPAERWWEKTPAAPAQPARRSWNTAVTLPAPPPLSAPLGMAGTGPLPQLSRTMAPAGTTWWAAPGKSSAQTVIPQPPGSVPQPPAPAARRQPGPASGGVALGLGVLLLVVGAAMSAPVLVFAGLALGAGGVYWLIARSGPPGPPAR
jgi:hypothetical protein